MSLPLTEEILRKGPREYFRALRARTKLSRKVVASKACCTQYYIKQVETNETCVWVGSWYMKGLLNFYKEYLNLKDDEILSIKDAMILCHEWQRYRDCDTMHTSWARQRLVNILGQANVYEIKDEAFLEFMLKELSSRYEITEYYQEDHI